MEILSAQTIRSAAAWTAAATLALAGCASTPEPEPAPSPPTGSEFSQGQTPPEPPPAPPAPAPLANLEPVYFDYDRSEIKSEARPKLQSNASALKNARAQVTIEGHCDERGDEEYNLALGERRANSVRKYLVALGVPSSQLRIVSYGEAKPAVQGHDESAWRWNRRAEFRASR